MGLFVDLGQFSIQNPTQFSRTFWSKTSLTVVYASLKEGEREFYLSFLAGSLVGVLVSARGLGSTGVPCWARSHCGGGVDVGSTLSVQNTKF